MAAGREDHNLPFEVGQSVESKWFITGYRGSWFRCKLKEISWKKGEIGSILEYIDFPDEKKNWTKFYQAPPNAKRRKKNVLKELMVRPCYPRIYREDEIQDSSQISKVAVVLDNGWMVGDLVDWWKDDVYWSGQVTQLLDGDKAQIKLPDPPFGEGGLHVGEFKDLRPSLDWSLDRGWTVPVTQVDGNGRCCAQLIQPKDQGELETVEGPNAEDCSADPKQKEEHNECDPKESCDIKDDTQLGLEDMATGKPSCSDSGPSSPFRNVDDMVEADSKDNSDEGSCKRMKTGKEVDPSFRNMDTLEDYVMQLEELASKVRWLQMLNKHGPFVRKSPPLWKFVDNRVSGAPK